MIDCLECLVLSTYFEGVYFQPKIILLEKGKLLLMAYNKLSSGCQNNVYINILESTRETTKNDSNLPMS